MRTLLTLALLLAALCPAATAGTLEVKVVDAKTKQPIAFRMHLKNQFNRPRKAPKQPFWMDHFAADGSVMLTLPRGNYFFEIDCGPEYIFRFGNFIMKDNAKDQKVVEMKRFVNLAELGYYAADFNLQRRFSEIPLVMKADRLSIAPVISPTDRRRWQPKATPEEPVEKFGEHHFFHHYSGQDRRNGNSISYLNLPEEYEPVGKKSQDFLGALRTFRKYREMPKVWIDVEKPASWDLPLWIGLGGIDSLGIAHSEMGRQEMNSKGNPIGKPAPGRRNSGARIEGNWAQEIYYHLLNCGLHIPPSGSSGSGLVRNPAGYNRVYAEVDGELTYQKWWDSMKAGKVFVTNGPILLADVRGEQPGAIFTDSLGVPLTLQASARLFTRQKISYLQVIRNGEVDSSLQLNEWAQNNGRMPEMQFEQSGWFLLRGICDNDDTFRFVSSAPFYVSIGNKPYISKKSVQFFIDWLAERRGQIEVSTPEEQAEVDAAFDEAREFWDHLLSRATVE